MKDLFIGISLILIASILSSCDAGDRNSRSEGGSDSLNYNIIEKEDTYGECDSTYNNCLQVKVAYPDFSNIDNIFIEKQIETNIDKFVFASFYEGNNLGAFEDLWANYVDHYNTMLDGAPESTKGWDVDRKVTVIYNKNKVLSLQYFEFSFTGGAHPNTYRFYDNFNVEKGNKIKLDDMLKEGVKDSLETIAEKKFREMKGLSRDQSLKSAGYWFDDNKFRLTDNFGIKKKGLVFFYNTYKIAPYAMGSTEMLLPYSDISSLLNIKYDLK